MQDITQETAHRHLVWPHRSLAKGALHDHVAAVMPPQRLQEAAQPDARVSLTHWPQVHPAKGK